jgi:hypothetical protein
MEGRGEIVGSEIERENYCESSSRMALYMKVRGS